MNSDTTRRGTSAAFGATLDFDRRGRGRAAEGDLDDRHCGQRAHAEEEEQVLLHLQETQELAGQQRR